MVAFATYAAFLAVVLLAPTSSAQSASASWLGDLGSSVGVPDRFMTQSRVEFVANALILIPLTGLASLVWPQPSWRDWTAYAFLVSGCVEVVQGLLLPARTASFADVVANTLGGLVGATGVAGVRRLQGLDDLDNR